VARVSGIALRVRRSTLEGVRVARETGVGFSSFTTGVRVGRAVLVARPGRESKTSGVRVVVGGAVGLLVRWFSTSGVRVAVGLGVGFWVRGTTTNGVRVGLSSSGVRVGRE
jgi:hypothetical protein